MATETPGPNQIVSSQDQTTMVETEFLNPDDREYHRRRLDANADAYARLDPPQQPKYRFLTLEELEMYDKIMKESEGFGAWQRPENILDMDIITPYPVSEEERPDEYEYYKQDSMFALDQYNNKQGTKFQFVKVLQVNINISGIFYYYLTFQAKDTTSSAFENFQALVAHHFPPKREVMLVRLEPKKSLPLEENGKGTSIASINPSETVNADFSSTDVPVKSCL